MEIQRKILIVDDTAMFRELNSIFLARFGAVITAHSGEAALELARRERPSIIVTDLNMPGMGGDALCREIRRDSELSGTPVIILTSIDNAADHARAVRAGANDIVAKPISRMTLVESVSRFLRSPNHAGLSRVPVETNVRIRTADIEAWGLSANLSRGGIFIEADAVMPSDTEVELEFELPETEQSLHSTARVVWAREGDPVGSRSGMGLQFLAIDRDASRQIESFVFERARHDAPMRTARTTRSSSAA
jgi:uncharacterized protein (TIGR02266 family)